ncbi:type II secretion system GspH family protein [Dehalobacter sp. DCM]|uniref:type II secretion system protein n=1 Tax=Dehalobacter sp. DCM TaxID=2907827 RepID=UPI003081F50E|nr:type II secretion system GspH family protein [Dehalobacter sp. DCM]
MIKRLLKKNESGLTLLEVLVSLVMAGIIAAVILKLFISQYRTAKDILFRSDMTFSLIRAGQIMAAAVASADSILWTGGKLIITDTEAGMKVTDSYYIADKDNNGVPDLYREHGNVPTPVASGVTQLDCRMSRNHLWEISITAGVGESAQCWQRKVRQKGAAN